MGLSWKNDKRKQLSIANMMRAQNLENTVRGNCAMPIVWVKKIRNRAFMELHMGASKN